MWISLSKMVSGVEKCSDIFWPLQSTETYFINLSTTLPSMYSKVAMLELNRFKIVYIFLQWNHFINEILTRTLIHKTVKSGFLLKWKEIEKIQNLYHFNFLLIPQSNPRRILRIWWTYFENHRLSPTSSKDNVAQRGEMTYWGHSYLAG